MTAQATGPVPKFFTADPPASDAPIIIAGAGLAGLFLALRLAPRPCIIISPAQLGQAAASAWAQGGIAAALNQDDSPEQHATDTIQAGGGLVDPTVAHLIAQEGPARVHDLVALGVPFDRETDGRFALSLEAAHSQPRVARVSGDLAGKAIIGALTAATHKAGHIRLVEDTRIVALLQDDHGQIAGVILQDRQGRLSTLTSPETVLCTGGAGGLFKISTNPPQAQGEALAMAYTVGAVVADPEFVQFHPTAMDVGLEPAPLATEALRGEGAKLVDKSGEAFMTYYHEQAELATRDEIARAIHMQLTQGKGAFLDTRDAIGPAIKNRFPTVFAACMAAGIDPRQSPIPVAPAMHYHMGGLVSDIWGRSSLNGLSICGECASTGAHGANRLASNALLETLVMAARIADRLREDSLPSPGPATGHVHENLSNHTLNDLRNAMSTYCGVVRDRAGLGKLRDTIDNMGNRYGSAHALTTARLIANSALARCESRGGHFRADYPQTGTQAVRTFIRLSDHDTTTEQALT